MHRRDVHAVFRSPLLENAVLARWVEALALQATRRVAVLRSFGPT